MRALSTEAARLLIDAGADIDARTNSPGRAIDGWTPLMMAASQSKTEVLAVLLASGADLQPFNSQGFDALRLAARNRNREAVRLLLEYGAKIGLVEASLIGNVDEIKRLLAATPDEKEELGTALRWAAFQGHNDVVRLLLDHGVAVDARDDVGQTALHYAAGEGQVETLAVLLERGTEVDARDDEGETALFASTMWNVKRSLEAVALLLDYGADVGLKNREGWTPLMQASQWGDCDVVERLLKNGADPNAFAEVGDADFEGPPPFNALVAAVGDANIGVVKVLLRYGADFDPFTPAGTSLLKELELNSQPFFQKERAEILAFLRSWKGPTREQLAEK